MNNEKRFGLLSEEDIQELYALPDFNDEERQLYFEFKNVELDIADKYDDPVTWIYCALQIGYFKAKLQFFKFGFDDVVEDANHIKEKYFPELNIVQFGCVSKYYINKQKKEISLAFEYKPWSVEYEPTVKSHVCELLKHYPKSQNALRQLLNYFSEENIVMPNYRKLQDIFTYAYSKEHERLSKLIESIPNEVKTQLNSLVEKNDRINDLNTIRADQKDFQFTAVRIEIDKVKYIRDLYEFSKQFISKLGLAKNAVRYYADLVEQYPPSRLRKLNKPTQQLLVLIHWSGPTKIH